MCAAINDRSAFNRPTGEALPKLEPPPPELREPADSELTPEKAELMSVWVCNQCWGMCELKAIFAAQNTSFPFLTTP